MTSSPSASTRTRRGPRHPRAGRPPRPPRRLHPRGHGDHGRQLPGRGDRHGGLIENEGNIRLTTSLPRVHVAIVGIEKLIPKMTDLAGFLQLTARAATGQPIGCFASLIQVRPHTPTTTVRRKYTSSSSTTAGPMCWHTSTRGSAAVRALRACLNACPVYRQTGGHAYGYVYSGPIGSVLDPGLLGLHESMPLPFASSLCGACQDSAPVRIPIRHCCSSGGARPRRGADAVEGEAALKGLATVATRPGLYRAAGKIGSRLGATGAARALPMLGKWARDRALPKPSRRTSGSCGGRGSSERGDGDPGLLPDGPRKTGGRVPVTPTRPIPASDPGPRRPGDRQPRRTAAPRGADHPGGR